MDAFDSLNKCLQNLYCFLRWVVARESGAFFCHNFATCRKSSSTGVSLPKIETKTLSLPLASSISEMEPKNSANGPSTILTASPSENVVLNLGASMVINLWIEETSDSGRGVGLLDMPTKLVMPGVVLTASQVASSRIILIRI